MSSTKVDLPLPETPVTQVKQPSGKETVSYFKLFSFAPTNVNQLSDCLGDRGLARCFGTGISVRPERYSAVKEFLAYKVYSSLPFASILPPRGPALWPRSI